MEEVFIGTNSIQQRAGRTGRVRDGWVFELFTKAEFLERYNTDDPTRQPEDPSICYIFIVLH
jgi:HrpA-like RNA helicase